MPQTRTTKSSPAHLVVAVVLAMLATAIAVGASPATGQTPVGTATLSLEALTTGAQTLYDAPGGNPISPTYTYLDGSTVDLPITNPTYFGNPLVLAVVATSDDGAWAQVMYPTRPNGSTAWVPMADYAVRAHTRTVHIIQDVRSLLVLDEFQNVTFHTPVGFGRSQTPTPTGLTYMDEVVPISGDRKILSLAMFSNAISTNDGGLPKIGIGSSFSDDLLDDDRTRGLVMASLAVLPELETAIGGPGAQVRIWATQDQFRAATGGVTAKFCSGLPVTVDLATGQQPTDASDVILGTSGDDLIAAGAGDDTICAFAGNDSIWGQAGDDLIQGGPGEDRLRGGDGNDRINGGAESDDIAAGRGDDWVVGGPGDDIKLRGGTGNDAMFGTEGNNALIAGNGGEDTITGGSGNEKITGGPRPDILYGNEGNDEIRGGGGADRLVGDEGDDRLFGGPQPDILDGGFGGGNDECNGGTEADQFINCDTIVDIP